MTSGLSWSESCLGKAGGDDLYSMWHSDNWVDFVLNQSMSSDPGESFLYCSGGYHLLSAILNDTTGETARDFAMEHLFEPIGVDYPYWPFDKTNVNNGASDLGITSRDMARFGYLFLNNGSWDGVQIISEDWCQQSVSNQVAVTPEIGYGYGWWLSPGLNMYSARGTGSQYITVIPDYDIIMVATGDTLCTNCTCNNQYTTPALDYVITNYIIPSVDMFSVSEGSMDYIPVFIIGASVAIIVIVVYGVKKIS